MLGSNCKFTACLLESVDVRLSVFVPVCSESRWKYIWLRCLFFLTVPIALHKKKHCYKTKEEVVFIPSTWFIDTFLANSDINRINAFERCTYAPAKHAN